MPKSMRFNNTVLAGCLLSAGVPVGMAPVRKCSGNSLTFVLLSPPWNVFNTLALSLLINIPSQLQRVKKIAICLILYLCRTKIRVKMDIDYILRNVCLSLIYVKLKLFPVWHFLGECFMFF